MPLSETQIDSVFEIMQYPRSTTIDRPEPGTYGLTSTPFSETNPDFQLTLKIEARLSALSAEQQVRIIGYIQKWDSYDVISTTLSGNLSSMTGIDFDLDKERAKIRERVKQLCQVYSSLNEIQTTKGNGGGFVPVIWYG
ncbi:hypothetical protein KAR91_53625 [Candidatus Pacearchaeota archaeon]|nr:hypothetical protein [Candidatus Pacearchaeota archaeon]